MLNKQSNPTPRWSYCNNNGVSDTANLPVERADKFYLVVNLKTAEALDLTLSLLFLSKADEVIK
jgi:ABC-type uncharacterized transport system substrate-binding protein